MDASDQFRPDEDRPDEGRPFVNRLDAFADGAPDGGAPSRPSPPAPGSAGTNDAKHRDADEPLPPDAPKPPLRLGPLVVSGEIDNTRPYAVCGWLKLRGQEHPITLNLTGDAGEGLRGKRVHFETAPGGVQLFASPDLSEALAWQQVGPTGPMTLDRVASVGPLAGLTPPASGPDPAPRGDYAPRSDRPDRQALRLEWDSQNGRVLLDLAGAAVTVLPALDDLDELDDPDLDWDDDEEDDEFLGLTGDDEDGLFASGGGGLLFDDEDDDPFGLFDPDLQDALDKEADAVDRESMPDLFGGGFGGFGEDDFGDGGFGDGDRPGGQFGEDLKRLEALIEGDAGVPIAQVFDPPLRLRRAEQLDDARVEIALKLLLSRMAAHGIALDVCEHFTPRQCYAYLLEEICPTELTHPDLDPVRWVQHFSTSDACPACEAEFEREFEEYERHRRRDGLEDDEE